MQIRTYEACGLPDTAADARNFTETAEIHEIRKRIRAVIQTEAPITERLLIKRVINSFHIHRAGSSIRPFMQEIMAGMNLKTTADEIGTVYWTSSMDPDTYSLVRTFGKYDETRREITLVPTAEIANAFVYILQKGPMKKAELMRNTARFLGYTRMKSNVKKGMDRGLKLAIQKKQIRTAEDGTCSLR